MREWGGSIRTSPILSDRLPYVLPSLASLASLALASLALVSAAKLPIAPAT